MTISNKNSLIKLLDSILLPRGFVRHKDNWYLDSGDFIGLISLSKSMYKGQFGLSINIFLKEINPNLLPYPPSHLCHFRGLSLDFITHDKNQLNTVLDLDNYQTDEIRRGVIENNLVGIAIPFLLKFYSKESAALEYRNNFEIRPFYLLSLKLALRDAGYLTYNELDLDDGLMSLNV